MSTVLQARSVTLRDLIDNFGLVKVRDLSFFPEWQSDLAELTPLETSQLDEIQAGYFNLLEYPPYLERSVQLSIISPLLFLGKFFLPPFHIRAEKSVELTAEHEGLVIRGNIDILLAREQFWVMVIESKEVGFSMEAGLAQLLSYMLANPHPTEPGFGLIATGGSFTFVKLVRGLLGNGEGERDRPCYALSRIFEIQNPGNELYDVFKVLKRIGGLPV